MTYPVSSPIASVPAAVIGEPEMVRPVGTVAATDVTVPEPDAVKNSRPVSPTFTRTALPPCPE